MGNKNNLIRIGPGFLVASAPSTIFSANGDANSFLRFLIRQISICNVTESIAAFSIWINSTDPSVTPPTDDFAIYRNKIIQPGENFNFYFSPGLRLKGNQEYVIGQASDESIITCVLTLDSFMFDWQDEN